MKRLLLFALLCGFTGAHSQITLDYETQTGSFNAQRTINTNGSYYAGSYNNGSTELGAYANGNGGGYAGDPGVALFRTFTTAASANGGTARPMQVGDEFSITCYVGNSSAFFGNSSAGISFNGGTASGAFSNYNTTQRAKFQISQNGNWFSATSSSGSGYATPGQDVTFKIKLTSAKTANLTISSGNGATSYDMVLANSPGASNNIQNFVIWNQTSGNDNNMFWKNASLKSTGSVEIGGSNSSMVFDGAITDGYLPNSLAFTNANSVTKSGTGTITFSAANSYTGNTRITGGSIRLSGAGTLGVGSNVYISNGSSIDLNGINATVASVQETGTNNGGTISLGSGTLTVSGGWTGTIYQNSISGTGGIAKQGTGNLTLYGTQSYTGATAVTGGDLSFGVAMASASYTVNGGTMRWSAANIIPNNAAVYIQSGTLNVDHDETINNLTLTGGSVAIAAGKILTVNGDLSLTAINQISLGSGAAIRYGSNGKLIYNVAGAVTVTATEWPASYSPSSVAITSGTITLNGNKTITGNLAVNGGTLNLDAHTISRASAGGELSVASGAVLSIGGTGTLPGNFGTHTFASGSTVQYAGAAQVIAQPSSQYSHLVVAGTGTKTLQGNTNVSGNLSVNAGTLDIEAHSLNSASMGAMLAVAGGATFKIGGTNSFPLQFAGYTLANASTVEYSGSSQSIAGLSYWHLAVSGMGGKILSGDVSTMGNLTVISDTLTVTSGLNLTVHGNVLNTGGGITLQNNANLLQDTATTVNANSGLVSIKRNSSPLYRQDYTLWSSPVGAQNMFAFSPSTLATRFYFYDTAQNAYDNYEDMGESSTTIFTPGQGYLIRMPNSGVDSNGNPTGTTSSPAAYQQGNATMTFNGKFAGVPNNGNISVALNTDADGYNLVGNPYPSPINIAAFRSANTNAIDGNIWFWRKTNASTNSAYVTVNSIGIYAGNNEPEQENPEGIIRTGQGFFVKVKPGYTATDVIFNNTMRNTDTANQFFRNAQDTTPENHGIWLNLTGANGLFSQMYTGYIAGATQGEDEGIDARYINDRPFMLGTLINNKEFTIQGRALPFSTDDVVPLHLRLNTAGNYQIALDHVNGIFAEGQDIFLKDNLLTTMHNLADGAYSFASGMGTFSNRFEIMYTNSTLGMVKNTVNDKVVVYNRNGNIVIDAGAAQITGVAVYDMRGRLVHSVTGINNTEAVLAGLYVQREMLLLEITTTEGRATKKIIF